MKKLILSLVCLFTFAVVNAQTPMTANSYTVTDTGADTLVLQVKGSQNLVSVQYTGTKVSGTVAGTATLYGSVTGVAYAPVPVKVIKGEVNAYTNTDIAVNSYIWTVTPSPYQYYKVIVVGTGTMVATVAGSVLVR